LLSVYLPVGVISQLPRKFADYQAEAEETQTAVAIILCKIHLSAKLHYNFMQLNCWALSSRRPWAGA